MKLRRIKFTNGERYVFLTCDDSAPHFLSTLWNTTELRPSNLQINSIANHLQNLKWLFVWEARNQRNLYAEFHRKKYLNMNDIEKIKKHLSLDINHLKALAKVKKKVISFSSIPQVVDAIPTISANVLYNRLSSVAKYLTFIAKVATAQSNDEETMQVIERMSKQLKAARPKRGKNKKTIGKRTGTGLPKAMLDEFIAVSRYDSEQNPFSNAGLRLRNDLLFRLLNETGIRPGELLSLRNDRIHLVGDVKSITVARTHDDPQDPRLKQPVSKTLERMIAIKPQTAALLHRYVTKVRKIIQGANKHPYLFVSHKGKTAGKPLSQEGFGQVVLELKKTKPEFAIVFPYYFRHHFNDVLSEKNRQKQRVSQCGG